MAPRVTVFLDYQNVHKSGHEAFCQSYAPIHECLVDPLLVAEAVIAQRAPGGTLEQVRVYRGRPDPRKEPRLASANDQQMSAWIKDDRVLVKRRALRYPEDWFAGSDERPQEKGIDVSVAIDMVRLAYENTYDVGILFSRDSDLLPPLEMIRDLKLAHVETAGWAGTTRIGGRGVYHHTLDQAVFEQVRDTRYYNV